MDLIRVNNSIIKTKTPIHTLQPFGVPATNADVTGLMKDFDCKPKTSLKEGITRLLKQDKEFFESRINLCFYQLNKKQC